QTVEPLHQRREVTARRSEQQMEMRSQEAEHQALAVEANRRGRESIEVACCVDPVGEQRLAPDRVTRHVKDAVRDDQPPASGHDDDGSGSPRTNCARDEVAALHASDTRSDSESGTEPGTKSGLGSDTEPGAESDAGCGRD